MSELLKNNISTYADLTAYNADLSKDFPNVSYIQATDEVKMYKYDPEYVVCKYNVTTTDSETKLLHTNGNISKQYIDSVEQQSVQNTYTFDTLGEHIVKYKYSRTMFNARQFQGCPNLISISIPNSFTSFGGYTFSNCTGLTKVNIPKNVTKIGYADFQKCTSFTSIIIPIGITDIYIYAFENCTSLTSITVEATTPPTLANVNAFSNTNNCPIYVPAASVEAYKAATNWSTYASRIQPIS